MSQPADVGTQPLMAWTGDVTDDGTGLNQRVAEKARSLPAAEPEMRPEEASFAPAGRK